MINLTPVAATKVKEIMGMQSPVPTALRVAVVAVVAVLALLAIAAAVTGAVSAVTDPSAVTGLWRLLSGWMARYLTASGKLHKEDLRRLLFREQPARRRRGPLQDGPQVPQEPRVQLRALQDGLDRSE